MKYMRLHKCKVEEYEHDLKMEKKQTSSDDQKVKRLSEAMQRMMNTYKDRLHDLVKDVKGNHHPTKDEAGKRTKG